MYHIVANPDAGFYVGTFLLALIIAVLGELAVVGLFLANREYFENINEMLLENHAKSVDAHKRGDREAFAMYNKQANEAFGKTLWTQLGLAVGSLWPVFFALAFLQMQFSGLGFSIFGSAFELNYLLIFFVEYILARLVLNPVKYLLPGMHRLKQLMSDARQKAHHLQTLLEDEDRPIRIDPPE